MFKSFWLGVHLDNFLFKGYDLVSLWGLLATCVAASSLAILYEGGRIYKVHMKSRVNSGNDENTDASTDTTTLMASHSTNPNNRISVMDRICHAAKYATLSVGHDLMGYLLMLSVMSFNLAIAIAVWIGAGMGYFIFASNISIPNSSQRNRKCNQWAENERSSTVTPNEGTGTASNQLAENVGGEEEFSNCEISEPPLNPASQDLNDCHDNSPDLGQSEGPLLTATAIIHREPSP